MNKAIWLGFFFFVALVLLLFGSLALTKIPWGKQLKIRFDFDRIEGLRKGDDIRVEGLKVGKVDSIKLRDYGIRVTGVIEEEFTLHEGYQVFVESFTLLGGNFISISRGPSELPVLPPNTVLIGKAKPSALDTVGKVLSENKDLITEMLTSVKGSADEAKRLIQAIRTGEGTLPRLINDPKIFDGLLRAVDEFRLLAEKANNGTGTLGKLINDPSLYDELKGSLVDIRAAAGSARQMIDKIATGRGALGKLMNDPKVAEDLEKLMENLRKSSEDLQKIMGDIASGKGALGKLIQEDTLYEKGKSVLDSADNVLGRVGRARVFLGTDYSVYPESEYSASKLFLRIWPDETKYFQAGVSLWSLSAAGPRITFKKQVESGEDDTKVLAEVFAMYKIPWFFDNHLGLRAGLMEGKAGGGLDLDFKLGEWPLLMSFDMRDSFKSVEDEKLDENIHGPMTRLYLKAPLYSPGGDTWVKQVLYALKIRVGASRLQDDPEYFISGGFEFEDQDIRTLIGLLGLSR